MRSRLFRRLLSLLAVLALCVCLPAAAARASSSFFYDPNCPPDPDHIQVTRIIVRSHGVSLREGPSVDTRKIRGIQAGEVVDVLGYELGWYRVCYQGEYGYVTDSSDYVRVIDAITPAPLTLSPTPLVTPTPVPATATPNRNPSPMPVPALGADVIGPGRMNMAVFWVQTQLKATGEWYQDDRCEVSGLLDDATQAAVSGFMAARGFESHPGHIDQTVVDTLLACLGSRAVAVYTGGFYEAMDLLLPDGLWGEMALLSADGAAGSSAAVRFVQRCLAGIRCYTGEINGVYTEATRAAVLRFQRLSHFSETGAVTLGTARAMLEAYFYQGGDLSALGS